MIEDSDSLGTARDWLRANAKTGARCPCCRQYVKVYRRKLNGSMTRVLIAFYREWRSDGGRYQNVFDILKRDGIDYHGADYSKLAYWNLLEQNPEEVGRWRITEDGIRFAQNRYTVPSHAVIYDGRCLRVDGYQVDVIACLGKKFNYNELMAERPLSREPS